MLTEDLLLCVETSLKVACLRPELQHLVIWCSTFPELVWLEKAKENQMLDHIFRDSLLLK